MPPLASALLRTWGSPEFALASARVGLVEALATGCPLRTAEWRRAVVWLEWLTGPRPIETEEPTEEDILETMAVRQPPIRKKDDRQIIKRKLINEGERG